MKNLLKQALMEYKENHKNDSEVQMEKLDYLIEKNEKDLLCSPYLAIAYGEVEFYLESIEDDEELKEDYDFIKNNIDKVAEGVNSEIMSIDSIWSDYHETIEEVVEKMRPKSE